MGLFKTRTKAARRRSDRGSMIGAERAQHRESAMRQLVRKHGGACAICNEPVSFKEGSEKYATIDHIRPVSKGGLDTPANWQLACHACNQAKGNTFDG